MSSPLSSLDKSRKPLSNPSKTFGKRSMPFRPNSILNTAPGLLNPISVSPVPSERSKSAEDLECLELNPSDSIDSTLNKLSNEASSERLLTCGDLSHPASSLFSTPRRNKGSQFHPAGTLFMSEKRKELLLKRIKHFSEEMNGPDVGIGSVFSPLPKIPTQKKKYRPAGSGVVIKQSEENLQHLLKCQTTARSTSSPSDLDLLSTMVKRITQLEKQTAFYTKEVVEKDKKIKILEEKVQLLNRYKNINNDGNSNNHGSNESNEKITLLENKCQHLQEQVHEMEKFLQDYGMIWVGDDFNDELGSDDEYRSPVITVNNVPKSGGFNTASSLNDKELNIDFDAIIRNIQDLNIIANEDGKAISKTKDGARFNAEESISLTLYSNGIFMFNGPFRSYMEPTTKRCIKDICDGYFPSELEHLYPEGVAIKVTDMRGTKYQDRKANGAFSGVGYSLLSHSPSPTNSTPEKRDRLTPSESSGEPLRSSSSNINTIHSTSNPPHGGGTQQLLDKVPKSVIRNGKVVDVRESLREMLSGGSAGASSCGRASTEVVCTESVQEMQDRMKIPETVRPTSARDVATIRIKSETGKKTYLLKMKFNDTIGDLHKYIDKQRPSHRGSYEIMSTFPNRKHTELKKTLLDSGLTPNAALHLKPLKKAAPARKPFC